MMMSLHDITSDIFRDDGKLIKDEINIEVGDVDKRSREIFNDDVLVIDDVLTLNSTEFSNFNESDLVITRDVVEYV
jgi:hypothetical protein